MQTNFSAAQLADSHMQASEKILRTCVHCGFCTATCPTYLLLGDELDSPRGRIYMIKDMLENGKPATKEVVKHVDRCLSCLSCMTTCPSGVNYMHLVDHARAYIEQTYKRPLSDRFLRGLLGALMPYPNRFRFALLGAVLAKPFKPLLSKLPVIGRRMAAMVDLAPATLPTRSSYKIGTYAVEQRKKRVVLLNGCVQPVLMPGINDTSIELLNRLGVEVVLAKGETCCGSLPHHMGKEDASLAMARANIMAWEQEMEKGGLDAIVITASGCGTTIKDYGFMLRDDAAFAERAAKVSALAMDLTEFMATLDLPAQPSKNIVVAYHSACSMQHGQKITTLPKTLLSQAGFTVKDVPEGHICCGSAGTYNILQPEIANQLRARKVKNIERIKPQVIAAGNIGCLTQIAKGTGIPIVHTVALLNWAYGGEKPAELAGM
eukprot:gene18278-18539_t